MRPTAPIQGVLNLRGSVHPDRVAMAAVAAAAREAGLCSERLDDIRTAVAEACINAMEHGNGNRPELPVEISFGSGAGVFSVSIRDQGHGFAPDTRPHPRLEDQIGGTDPARGWGLFLMQQLADRVEVRSGQCGCQVELSFNFNGNGGAADEQTSAGNRD